MISIIIPVYNVAPYIERCIRSVIHQSYSDIEIILVDDGSTDVSGLLCDKLSNEDERIHVFHTENRGLSEARNCGLHESKGELVYYLDADDEMMPEALRIMHESITMSGADICVGGFQIKCQDGRILKQNSVRKDELVMPNEYLEYFLSGHGEYPITAWNKLMHRRIAERVLFPVGRNFEDYFVIVRLLSLCERIAMVSNITYSYFLNRIGSITLTYSWKNLQDRIDASGAMINDIHCFFSDNPHKNDLLEKHELRDSLLVWKYLVMYLESVDRKNSETLYKKLVVLKLNYENKIRCKKGIISDVSFKMLLQIWLIKYLPGLAGNAYVIWFRMKEKGVSE